MSSKTSITSAIDRKVGLYPTSFRIGLTRDLNDRRQYWTSQGKVKNWEWWATDSLEDAKDIENYGINTLKMKGGTGGDLSGTGTMYVYVFET